MKTVKNLLSGSRVETSNAELSKATIRQKVQVPIAGGTGQFVTFRGLKEEGEHVAVVFEGPTPSASPLVRVHSECLTGDVFLSGKCDCGEQLREAVSRLQREGGVLIYLRQEGRGIGLYNKLDAYALQSRGHDTYESNRLLGFRDDLRSYSAAAQMLGALGLNKIRLLSNNPDKARQLGKVGILVTELVSTGVFVKEGNRDYLLAKVKKTGHQIAVTEILK